MHLDWTVVTALGTSGAAMAALIAALITWRIGIKQVQTNSEANGVNLAIQIRAHVNSPEFRGARYKASKALLGGSYTSDVVYVLDELETIGLLLKRKVLDAEIIWTMASSLVVNYAAAARQFIAQDRERNPTLWTNLLFLDERMIEVERSQGGTEVAPAETFQRYLEMELKEMARFRRSSSRETLDPHAGGV